MDFQNINKFRHKSIIIRGHPKGTHTHSWIHYRFWRAFDWLGFDVQWLDNKIENLPDQNKEYIIITECGQHSILLQNPSKKWIIFDHNMGKEDHVKYINQFDKLIPFGVIRYNLAKFTDKKISSYITERDTPVMSTEEYYYQIRCPRILRACELLPHEIERKPYDYSQSRDVNFIGSRWHNNFLQLESLKLYCLTHGLQYNHYGRHLLIRPPLFKQRYLSAEELESKTCDAYIAPAVQGSQVDDGYIPCRLFIQMSLSVLGVSNNPYVYNLFDDDEVIVDRDIWKMMDKAQQVIKDRKVDDYTRKAIQKIKEKHTYLNRIDELFSYI